MTDKSSIEAERLLAQIKASNTRWWKISSRLLDFAVRDVPEDQEPRTPVKWVAAKLGCWMMDAQTKRINRRIDAKYKERQRALLADIAHIALRDSTRDKAEALLGKDIVDRLKPFHVGSKDSKT